MLHMALVEKGWFFYYSVEAALIGSPHVRSVGGV